MDIKILVAVDGEQALDIFFGAGDIDLLILDVMMPKYSGWYVLKKIREHSDVPVIMLTALGDEKHEVMGLNFREIKPFPVDRKAQHNALQK